MGGESKAPISEVRDFKVRIKRAVSTWFCQCRTTLGKSEPDLFHEAIGSNVFVKIIEEMDEEDRRSNGYERTAMKLYREDTRRLSLIVGVLHQYDEDQLVQLIIRMRQKGAGK